jgi:biofilm PGA synthesis N-glycosyltransferase PgaC
MSEQGNKYVLVTAAYNEEAYIERTIQSIIAQTVLPQRWAIVSDGSTDRTDEIVNSYAAKYPFIQLVRITEEHPRNWAAQVFAINHGCKQLQGLDFQFLGNVDSDVSFEPTYFSQLLKRFDENPDLGLAGGYICERRNGKFEARTMNSERSVAHAVQMFRRECFESLGGYLALPHGGPDWHALICARMHGWEVRAFPDLPVQHYRPTGGADRPFPGLFRQGRMDYSLGSYPPFEVLKLVRRCRSKPYVIGSLVRLSGFLLGYLRREKRPVSEEFVRYLQNDERTRFRALFGLGPRMISEQPGILPRTRGPENGSDSRPKERAV